MILLSKVIQVILILLLLQFFWRALMRPRGKRRPDIRDRQAGAKRFDARGKNISDGDFDDVT